MIRQAADRDAATVESLALLLWPTHKHGELADEFLSLCAQGNTVYFLYREGERAVGFAQCSLRHDYVEGTSSSPVGFLEGIFVLPEYRGSGRGGELLRHCEEWARMRGCREFGSDCELDNAQSLAFHLRAGFTEVNRVISFAKRI